MTGILKVSCGLRLFLECRLKFVSLAIVFLVLLCTNCVHKEQNIKSSIKDKTILNFLHKKLDDGSLTFDDIFNSDYGEYAEKNIDTADDLDALVKKLKSCLIKNHEHKGRKIDLDNMFIKNMDKIVDILIDRNNLKYGIYGTDETRWFVNDPSLKAPFNYFQQQVVLCVSGNILEEISIRAVNKIMNTEKDFIINFGILWSVYGNGNQLEQCFNTINKYINDREQDVLVKKQKLTQQQTRVLQEILEMQKIEDIITDGFVEYVAKSKIVAKCKTGLQKAKRILDEDAKSKRMQNKSNNNSVTQ